MSPLWSVDAELREREHGVEARGRVEGILHAVAKREQEPLNVLVGARADAADAREMRPVIVDGPNRRVLAFW
jgi:hypothetical protein